MDVYNINNPSVIPSQDLFVIADTNAAIRIINNDPTAIAFISFLATNGGVLCISEKTYEEIHIIHDNLEVMKERYLPTERGEQIQNSAINAKADLEILLNNEIFYPQPLPIKREDKLEFVEKLRIKHKLCWPDAYVMATAVNNGIPLLWTHDSDYAFCKIPGIGIVTDIQTKTKFTRTGMVQYKFKGF